MCIRTSRTTRVIRMYDGLSTQKYEKYEGAKIYELEKTIFTRVNELRKFSLHG